MQDIAKNRRALAPLPPSPLAGSNSAYLEELYEVYLQDPTSVHPTVRAYFDALPKVPNAAADTPHSAVRAAFRRLAQNAPVVYVSAPSAVGTPSEKERKQVRVLQLIDAYRVRGHQRANLDPLGLWQRP